MGAMRMVEASAFTWARGGLALQGGYMDHGCCRTGPAPLGQRLAMGAVGTVEASAFNWGRGGLAVRAGH